jgi:hypothetical protein
MSKQLTCKERIEDDYMRTEEYIDLMFKVLDRETLDEEDEDDKKLLQLIEDDGIDEGTIHEYAAGSTMKRLLTIELSGGGPASYIEAVIDEDGVVEKATYHFTDWWDSAERKIHDDSAMFRYVQWEAERYM